MSTALKNVPVQELQPPEGVVRVNGDWRYAEWADGGFIRSLGLEDQIVSPALALSPPVPLVPVVGPGPVVPVEVPAQAAR